jgi:predicted NBD/HSP70 family sugar kinase
VRALHTEGDVTRSQLCATTGLNRSTVATIVTELTDMGVVEERRGTVGGVGRPSLVVSLVPDSVAVIGWDVRVDTSRAIAMGLGGSIATRWTKEHRRGSTDPYEVAARIVTGTTEIVEELPDHVMWVGLGLAMPGVIDPGGVPPRSIVHRAPTLGWVEVDFGAIVRAALAEQFGTQVPVLLGNDANVGAMAEWTRGAGRGSRSMVFVSGDVGIGGGVIVDGALLTGATGFAGEIGHIRFDAAGGPCRCGAVGCWETVIGAETIVRSAGADPASATAQDVYADARAGHEPARVAALSAARAVGQGLASVVNVFNPDTVVLAGHLTELLTDYRHTLMEELRFTLSRESIDVRVVPPVFGPDSIVIGAAELGFEPMLRQPHQFFQADWLLRSE